MKLIGTFLKWMVGLTIGLFMIGMFLADPDAQKQPKDLALAPSNTVDVMNAQNDETLVDVPSDPRAKYFVQRIERRSDGALEIQSRRVGPSGESFAVRKVSCSPFRFGYIADADDVFKLSDRIENPEMSELVDGSISDVISRYACDNSPLIEG